MTRRRLGRVLASAVLIGLGTGVVAAPGSALAASKPAPKPPAPFVPGVPMGLSASDTRTNTQTVRVSWKTVAKSDHYDVLVSDGTTQTVYRAGPTVTFMDVPTPNICATYNVSIGARNANGAGGTTVPITLRSWGPGPVTNLRAARTGDGRTATITWGAAQFTGYHTRGNPKSVHDYRPDAPGEKSLPTTVSVIHDADRKVVFTRVLRPWDDKNVQLANLSPADGYTVQTTLTNEFGPCSTRAPLG